MTNRRNHTNAGTTTGASHQPWFEDRPSPVSRAEPDLAGAVKPVRSDETGAMIAEIQALLARAAAQVEQVRQDRAFSPAVRQRKLWQVQHKLAVEAAELAARHLVAQRLAVQRARAALTEEQWIHQLHLNARRQELACEDIAALARTGALEALLATVRLSVSLGDLPTLQAAQDHLPLLCQRFQHRRQDAGRLLQLRQLIAESLAAAEPESLQNAREAVAAASAGFDRLQEIAGQLNACVSRLEAGPPARSLAGQATAGQGIEQAVVNGRSAAGQPGPVGRPRDRAWQMLVVMVRILSSGLAALRPDDLLVRLRRADA